MFETMLQREVCRASVRYAAGRAIECPCCGDILDAPTTVLATDEKNGGAIVLCARCWGHAPWSGRAGSVEVLDGRTLWEPTKRVRQWRAA